MVKHKSIKALEWLLGGGPIKHDGYTFVLDEDYHLCTLATKIDGKTGEKGQVLLKTHMELQSFIKLFDKLDDKEFKTIGANFVLNSFDQNE